MVYNSRTEILAPAKSPESMYNGRWPSDIQMKQKVYGRASKRVL